MSKSFRFVNTLSVADADEVRENLTDGNINGDSYSIKVADLKTVSSLVPSMFYKHPAPAQPKHVSVRLASAWLPLNQDIGVEVVDYLLSPSSPADLFALTVVSINNPSIRDRYEPLRVKMNSYAQLQPFENVLQIGFVGMYRESPQLVRRCHRISTAKVYLLDIGKIIAYDKTNL